MIHYYVAREQAGDGTLWQAYSDAGKQPVCLPTTEAAATQVALDLGRLEHDRAWTAATPHEREQMADSSGT